MQLLGVRRIERRPRVQLHEHELRADPHVLDQLGVGVFLDVRVSFVADRITSRIWVTRRSMFSSEKISM